MDLMGGKSLQITFFKLLNYKSRDTNWFFVPLCPSFTLIYEYFLSELFKCGNYIVLVADAIIAQWDDGDELN